MANPPDRPMRHYAVVSPVYEAGGFSEPSEPGSDYVEVDARTKREALVAGLRKMRADSRMQWWRDNAPGSPFRGLKAIEMCAHGMPLEEVVNGWCEDCGGPGPCPKNDGWSTFCELLAGHPDPCWDTYGRHA